MTDKGNPSHQFRGPVLNRDGLCTAFPAGSTWTVEGMPEFAHGMRTYHFIIDPDTGPVIKVGTAKAINLTNALRAIGFGCAYEEEWGDFAAFLQAWKRREVAVLREAHTIDVMI